MREQTIFIEALECEDPAARAAFLDEACAADPALRERVERLLRRNQQADDLLDSPSPWAAAVDVPVLEGVGTVNGPYKLLEQIGEGGMGVVYMAEQEQPVRRRVALKVLKAGMDSAQVLARFEAERQALALMDHPNIAKVLDAGTTGSGRPYFVMELVKGVPITAFCDEHRLALRERLELFVPVCQAVQHAHQKGIIHRDLKPSNVLVALYDDRSVPKVIDFGVAKATNHRLTERTLFTEFGSVIGTLEYMSPEQAKLNALDVDTRSDIYALGVLLYELLTGTTPFEPQRLQQAAFDERLRLVREEEPAKPSSRLSGSGPALATLADRRRAEPARLPGMVRGELDWIVMKALEKDRARRYETANGLARDLQRYLADEPVEACPAPAGYRLRKLARRYKEVLATAAAFVLLLVLAVAASTWQAVRATRAEREVRLERDRALAAERSATIEQANTQAALDFLWKDVLSQASFRFELDRNVKLRTVLDRVADRLERGPGQPPRVEAAVRQMVGALLVDFGEYAKAQTHLERALEVQRLELGEDDPQTLATMHHLGHCLYRLDREEAASLLGRTLALRQRVLGEEHDDTLLTARIASVCYANQGRYEEAEALLRQTLEIRRRVFGEQDRETLVTMYWLAGHLARRGKLEAAEELATRCVELSHQHDDDLIVPLFAKSTLVGVYIAQERPAMAEPLAVQVLEGTRRLVGDQHPFLLKAIHRLCRVHQLQGQYEKAAPLLTEALTSARKIHEDGHPNILMTLRLLGRNLLGEGKDAEAEWPLRECLQGLDRVQRGPPSRAASRAIVQGLLGESLLRQHKYAEAEPLLLASHEGLKLPREVWEPETSPPQERLGIQALKRLVRLYDTWDKPERAEPWRRELAARIGPAGVE
jgi:serine/threonine protein kinase/tetratricopeptide (TPR) repeat protein